MCVVLSSRDNDASGKTTMQLTTTELALAEMCHGREMIHDYARVLAHEWPFASPVEVATSLWPALSDEARGGAIIQSISDAYDVWGPYLEAKHGSLPRAGDCCDGTKEMVRDLAEAEAQRKLALTVELERGAEFFEVPTWGYTVQSWAIATGTPYEHRALTIADAFGVDKSIRTAAPVADSDGMATTENATSHGVRERPPYLDWIWMRTATFADFNPEDASTLEINFGDGDWARLSRNGSELTIQYNGDEAYPEFADWIIIDDEYRLPLLEAVEKALGPLADVRRFREPLADHILGAGASLEGGLWWMTPENAYATLIQLTLKCDSLWDDDDPLPADEVIDHVLAMLEGSALLERVTSTLHAVEPNARHMVEILSDAPEGDAAEPDTIVLSCLRGYLERYIQIEREEPAESIQEGDRKALARRLRYGVDSIARYAREVAKSSDMSSRALADYLVGDCLDEDQRLKLAPSGDCWELADSLTAEIRDERGESRGR